jgi:hypothetical protein
VWEYYNPMTRDGIKRIKLDNYPTYNGVFRAYRYTGTHPALTGHDLTAGKTITGYDPVYITPSELNFIKKNEDHIPTDGQMIKNYPNPFKSATTIQFDIPNQGQVNLIVYDLSGNHVKTLVNETRNAGNYSIDWDGKDESGNKMSTGTYYYVLKIEDQQVSKKMILIK